MSLPEDEEYMGNWTIAKANLKQRYRMFRGAPVRDQSDGIQDLLSNVLMQGHGVSDSGHVTVTCDGN